MPPRKHNVTSIRRLAALPAQAGPFRRIACGWSGSRRRTWGVPGLLRGLAQDPPDPDRALPGDVPVPNGAVRAADGRGEPGPGRQLARRGEPGDVADLGHHDQRGEPPQPGGRPTGRKLLFLLCPRGPALDDGVIDGAIPRGVEQHRMAACSASDIDGEDHVTLAVWSRVEAITAGRGGARFGQVHGYGAGSEGVRRPALGTRRQAKLAEPPEDFGHERRTPSHPSLTSRCRARHYHGQGISVAPGAAVTGTDVTTTGPERRVLPGWPLQRQGHLKVVPDRFAGTIFRTRP